MYNFDNPHIASLISLQNHPFTAQAQTASSSAFFYGANVDMTQILPTSQNYFKNSKGEDLIDIAGRLGIRTLRITNSVGTSGNEYGTYTKQEWDSVLNKMQTKNIKALIVIENPTIYSKDIGDDYLTLVQDYIINSDVLSNSNVYAVDLKNEPVINDNNVSKIKAAAQMIKAKYPKTLLTVGWWAVDTFQKDQFGQEIYDWDNYAAGRNFDSFIDFYCIHMYGFDQKVLGAYPDPYLYTKTFITAVKNQLQTTKPLIIEEFGAPNGEAISDQGTIGNQELQANVYSGVYQAIKDMGDPQVVSAISYQLNARTSTPDAWAILKDQGNSLFPAAYVLQLYATGKSEVALSLPYKNVPNNIILSQSDNNKRVTVKPNDIVGLNLSLPQSSKNILSISNPSLLTISQPLTYNYGSNKYETVFHAKSAGTVTISIINSTSKRKVYSVTISISRF